MAVAALKAQLERVIQSMHDEGLIDENFEQIRELNNEETPRFIVNLIPPFLTDGEECIREFTALLGQSDVDFQMVLEWSIKLKGSCSCVGAHLVAAACCELREACDDRNKEGCLLAFDKIKHDLQNFQRKLRMILQLQRRIHTYEAMQL